jgi:hypothetical protein
MAECPACKAATAGGRGVSNIIANKQEMRRGAVARGVDEGAGQAGDVV